MQVPNSLSLALAALLAAAATLPTRSAAYEFNALPANASASNANVVAAHEAGATATLTFSASDAAATTQGGDPVGAVVALNPQDYQLAAACQAQKWTITQKKAASMWLQFSAINLPAGDQLVAVSANGKQVPVEAAGVATAPIPGSIVTLEYRPSPSCAASADNYGFTLDQAGLRYSKEWTVTKEAVCGVANTMQNAKCFAGGDAEDKAMYAKSRAVLRTERVREDGNLVVCTAWLWGNKGHLVTNHHCFSSQAMVDKAFFHFGVEAASCEATCTPGTCPVARAVNGAGGIKFLGSDAALDVAILQLTSGAEEIVNTFGYLQVLFGKPAAGDQIYIPQHPGGGPRQIAKTDDDRGATIATIKQVDVNVQVEDTLFKGLIGYAADTLSGSSGSPVISRKNNLVLGLHRIGFCNNAATPSHVLLDFLYPFGRGINGLGA